ncbi:MAG: phosphatidate cytidylyltransferase [Planctomycetes bacterium]|nr:phosphatidate cytidylyltransferase [Planctomycetota bacterium]
MSKAKKILRRTLSGGSLVLAVAALLWWTNASADGRPIFYAAAVITLCAVYETSRMGTLALYDLLPTLALSAFGVLALTNAHIESQAVLREAGAFTGAGTHVFRASTSLLYGFALLTGLAAYSVTRAVKRSGGSALVARLAAFAVVGAAVLYALDDIHAERTHLNLVLAALGGVTILGLLTFETGGFARLSLAGLLCAWIVPALSLLVFVWDDFGIRGLIALLVLSKIGDTFGYYVGSALGRTHPFPRLSPGKTTAGCVGSFVGAVSMGGLLWGIDVLPDGKWGLTGALAAAAIVNLAAQSGDLLESFAKRKAGVKDSSGVFGPSGGLLDQLDSLLLSVPVACLVWPYLLARTA